MSEKEALIIVPVYEVTLEFTESSSEVTYHKFLCNELPKTYKNQYRMYHKEKEGKVTKKVITASSMKFRTWTLNEQLIPEMHEMLRMAAVREISAIQTRMARMYDAIQPINRDLPPVERRWFE